MNARTRRILLLATAALLIGGAAAATHVALAAMHLRDGLREADAAATVAMGALGRGDLAATEAAVREATTAATDAAPADPLWRIAEAVPMIGPNLSAARVAAEGLGRLGNDVATPLLDAARSLEGADPRAALEALRESATRLDAAERARTAVADEVARVPREHLVAEVAAGLDTLSDAVSRLAPITQTASSAASLLPAILGADGERTILLLVQNPAELRTGGGITGSFVELRAVDGEVTLSAQRDSSRFAPAAAPILPLPVGEQRALGDGIGRFVQNASMTADFALTARLASAWWESDGFAAPDVVVSLDPIVLAAVLGPLGSVDTAAGPFGPGDVVDHLLVEPYLTLSPDGQTDRFADVAGAVVSALATRAEPLAIAVALREPIGEGRLSVWSRHPHEQAILGGTALAGPRARLEQAGADAFAVYFNDATGGKLTPYLDVALAVRTGTCRVDRLPEVEVEVQLASRLPVDAADVLPISVTGGGLWGATSGFIAPTVSVVAPPGWFAGGVRVDGEPVSAVSVSDGDRPAVTRRTDVRPSTARTLTFRFISPARAAAEPAVLHTPLLAPLEVTRAPLDCAG
ncbi:DUF4012 domain-containing protein [Microbacterium sp. 179-B 1A2 NHS]|uniref:DUF4012 domain-containing protein n=1 Tax=Microbacterium sp. 179-B 1A2 NHS TaxID=3142383 RepID=UPI0039A0AF10